MVVCSLVSLVCFILVLVAMFKNEQTVMGIVCIVTIFCGIGGLIAFVYGWMKAGEWNLQQVMLAWTGAFVLYLILFGINFAMVAGG
jgi:hypothetical protein